MKLSILLCLGLLVLLPMYPVFGMPPTGIRTNIPPRTAQIIDNQRYIDANYLFGFVGNVGEVFHDAGLMFGRSDGLYYPYLGVEKIVDSTANKHLMYGAGLWMGGLVDGQLRLAIAEYGTEFGPGSMISGTFDPDRDNLAYRVYKIYSDSMASNPNQDYIFWPIGQGAPVDQYYSPLLTGDQTLFSVYNDADPALHTISAGTTAPLGVEVRQTVWAERGAMVFDSMPTVGQYTVTPAHPSDDSVVVEIVNPLEITGHDYRVEVRPDSVMGQCWDLLDLTISNRVLKNQAIPSFARVAGMQIEVKGPNVGVLVGSPPDLRTCDPGNRMIGWCIPNGTRRFTWANADGLGLPAFYGALGWDAPVAYYNGMPKPVRVQDLRNVLLTLATTDLNGNPDPNDPNVSYGYRYLRNAQVPPARPEFGPFIKNPSASYAFQDFTKGVPLAAWNTETDPPTRLAVGWSENNTESGLVDGRYWPPYSAWLSNTSSSGPYEWLFIFNAPYSETPNPAYETNVLSDPGIPIMYWATWARRAELGWAAGDELAIYCFRGISQVDSFTFAATKPPMQPFEHSTDNRIFVKYDLYNKGSHQVTDMYLSVWSDPDLGGAADDLVGCDTVAGIFYCYNGTNDDNLYHATPPAVGLRIVQGPIVPSPGSTAQFFGASLSDYRNLKASSFNKYNNGTDPTNARETYYYMRGLNKDGSVYTYNGVPTTFFVSGDPVAGTGDLDVNPADRKMMVSVGPFNFNPGDSQQFIVEWGVGQGWSAVNSLSVLKTQVLNDPNCCVGTTGNVDGLGIVDLADLSLLVSYLTKAVHSDLPCHPAANVNGRDIIDLVDLSWLIAYLTVTPVPPLPSCP